MSNSTSKITTVRAGIPAFNELTAVRRRGYMDARDGVGFPKEYDASWKRHEQINYERGRHQYAIAKASLGRAAPRWKLTEVLADVFDTSIPGGKLLLRQTKGNVSPYVDRVAP